MTVDHSLLDGVEGWLSDDQVDVLADAARATGTGDTIVEIGSFRGRSTIVLAASAPDGVAVVAIDPHAGNDRGPQEITGYADAAADDHVAFDANLRRAGVRDRVRHVRKLSGDAHADVDGPIAVLFVDGAHRYGPAREDIADWGWRVQQGGALLIHDAFSSVGVTLAILRELLVGPRFRYVGRARSLAIYRADLGAGPAARLRNAASQLRELPWFARNLALKIVLTLKLGRLWRATGRPEPEWPY
jgi:predicted O-methyltransferase YrrM